MIEIDTKTAKRIRALLEAVLFEPLDEGVGDSLPVEWREAIEDLTAVDLTNIDRALRRAR